MHKYGLVFVIGKHNFLVHFRESCLNKSIFGEKVFSYANIWLLVAKWNKFHLNQRQLVWPTYILKVILRKEINFSSSPICFIKMKWIKMCVPKIHFYWLLLPLKREMGSIHLFSMLMRSSKIKLNMKE